MLWKGRKAQLRRHDLFSILGTAFRCRARCAWSDHLFGSLHDLQQLLLVAVPDVHGFQLLDFPPECEGACQCHRSRG